MAILTVGPSSTFPTIAAAMAAAGTGDIISLEAGYGNENAAVTVDGLSFDGGPLSTDINLQLGTGISAITLLGTAPINVLDGPDANTIVGNDGDNIISVSSGVDVVTGGNGTDRLIIDYSAAMADITGTLVNVTDGGTHAVTFTGVENFTTTTGSGNDTITVGDGFNVLSTGAGDDTITAGNGPNIIDGGSNNDTITTGGGVNTIQGGDGNDTIVAGDGGNTIDGGAGDDGITSGAGNDTIITGLGNDTVIAGGGNDVTTVNGGIDTVDSGSGTDRLIVDYSSSTTNVNGGVTGGTLAGGYDGAFADVAGTSSIVFHNTERFTVTAGIGNDVIATGDGADVLDGGAGNDQLNAAGGDDILVGGAGLDTLYGGSGSDKFMFDSAALTDAKAATPIYDDIKDYDHGNTGSYSSAEGDQIDLSAILSAAYNQGSGQPISSLVQLVEDSSGTFAKLQVDSDGAANGVNWVTIAQLDNIAIGNTINVILDASLPSGTTLAPESMFENPIGSIASFGATAGAGGWSSETVYPRELADVNGDGMADIVGFGNAGALVSLATGNGQFAAPIVGIASFGATAGAGGWSSNDTYPRELADVNGDGMADIIGFGNSGVLVSLATGGGHFANPIVGIASFGATAGAGGWVSENTYPREMADVNGDGMADIVGFGNNGVLVSLATGGGQFAAPIVASPSFGATAAAGGWSDNTTYPRELADINGDGKADIVAFGNGGVFYALGHSDGTFGPITADVASFGATAAAGGWSSEDIYPRLLADVTGDHRADIVGFGNAGVLVGPAHDFFMF